MRHEIFMNPKKGSTPFATDRGYVLFLCHVPAFFSALVTGFRALLTMLRFMFGAFIAARLTNLRA
jgi:hypothetical protein